jgi:hypothetical protein
VDGRVLLLELREDDRQDRAAGPGRRPDLEPAVQLALGLVAELGQQLLLDREQALRAPVEARPGLGRLDAAPGPVEELQA